MNGLITWTKEFKLMLYILTLRRHSIKFHIKTLSVNLRHIIYTYYYFGFKTFYVIANNGTYSQWYRVDSGIPQGSIIGPLLFLIYINDLPNVTQNTDTRIFLYADDAKIYRRITCVEKYKGELPNLLFQYKKLPYKERSLLYFNIEDYVVI